jgi:hypothetical protein
MGYASKSQATPSAPEQGLPMKTEHLMNQQYQPPNTEPVKGKHLQDIPEQTLAEQTGPFMTTEEVDALYAEMEQTSQRMLHHGKRMARSMYIVAAFCGLYALLSVTMLRWHIYLPLWSSYLLGLFPAIVIVCFSAKLPKTKDYLQALDSLANSDDLRAIGPLASVLHETESHRQSHRRRAFLQTLTRLLPRLQATDTSLFTEKQQASLYYMLQAEYSSSLADFQIAVLKAFEQVGGLQALPHVERLAAMTPTTKNNKNKQRVMKAAQECLLYLRQRADQERSGQTLLRASQRSDPDPIVLLRPATATREVKPQELLRSGDLEHKDDAEP